MEMTSTKISGLAVDTEYTFHLVLRTSAGIYTSERLAVRTHKMTDLSGITVTPGVMAAPLRENLIGAVDRIGAKIAENVRIDTTHFVCVEGRGREWERALEMNIPVVRPEWIEGCEREGRIVGVRGYYLNADPKLRQVGQGVRMQTSPQQRNRTESQASPRADGQAGSNPSIAIRQQSARAPLDPPQSASANNLKAANLPPAPSSPSDGGSPAPPPPEKDSPRRHAESQPSPLGSSDSIAVSANDRSVPSQVSSDEDIAEPKISRHMNDSKADEHLKREPEDSGNFEEVSI